MNDQAQMMNLNQQSQIINQQTHLMNQQSQLMKHQSQMINQQSQPPPMINPQSQLMNHSQIFPQAQAPLPPILNRSYKAWPQPFSLDPNNKFLSSSKPNFVNPKQLNLGRSNWKNKKGTDKNKNTRRVEKLIPNNALSGSTGYGGYKPPTLYELQSQNRLKARKFYPKKKFNNRIKPYAPRNTTSYLIRAKRAGGIPSLVSPYPVTPSVLPTPILSPSREVLGDTAKEEWGVNGYGSMKGLIRLRSPGNEAEGHVEEEDEEGGGSSESDVEEHVEMERRLDHDLSRFEMIYPNHGVENNNVLENNHVLENRVDDQDTHIAKLEEENLTLKERLFLMERELGDLRRRLQCLERQNHLVEDINEEVMDNESENESVNDSEGGSDVHATGGENNEETAEYVSGNVVRNFDTETKGEDVNTLSEKKCLKDVCMEEFERDSKDAAANEFVILNEFAPHDMIEKNGSKDGEAGRANSEKSIGGGD